MKRAAPMKRSAMGSFKSGLPRGPGLKRGAPMKISTPMKRHRTATSKIRLSARGEDCTLRFPCCNRDPATTVWCHSNRLEDGKGMGLKAHDQEGCYGCSNCHAFLDGGYVAARWPRAVVEHVFDAARAASQRLLRAKGLLDGR